MLNRWQDIMTFSEFNSGRLSLLRTLKIYSPTIFDSQPQPHVATPPLPIFRDSINLDQFIFHFLDIPLLRHFVFPNLTKFELSTGPEGNFSASYLLDFLKDSPLLQTVKINIFGTLVLRNIPEEMVVVLPNAETFSLHTVSGRTTQVYDIASHISCPRARYTSLTRKVHDDEMDVNLAVFPTPVSWNRIIHQYTASPIEVVKLEINDPINEDIECSLTFRSSDATTVRLGFDVDATDEDGGEFRMPRAEMGWEIFSQALTSIRDHPLLPHVKRLHIKYEDIVPDNYETRMAHKVRELFNSLEPLDELTIRGCDLRIFLRHFLRGSWFNGLETPLVFLQAKELTILNPSMGDNAVGCASAILELAKLQHALAMPFERVTVSVGWLPIWMKEELERWVGVVDFSEEEGV